MEKSSDKLVVCRFRDGVLSTWFQSGRAAELEFSRAHETEVGAIYLARVSHVQKNINAAFLDIGKGVNAYLNLEKAKKIRLANGEPIELPRERSFWLKSKRMRTRKRAIRPLPHVFEKTIPYCPAPHSCRHRAA